ncbi:MAG: hypothetical protein ACPGQT_03165, partial [Rhodothermales bacterium]
MEGSTEHLSPNREGMSGVAHFLEHHFCHFNAAALIDAAKGYVSHLEDGGRMMVTLAGAMSTAELGLSLAEMIRAGHRPCRLCGGGPDSRRIHL